MNIRILYVDDDDEDVLLLQRLLTDNSDHPVDFSSASSFNEAVNLLNNRQFDLILVDYKLSNDPTEQSGLDLCRKLCDEGLSIPIALVSSLPDLDGLGFQDIFDRGAVFINKKDLFLSSPVHWLQEYTARKSRVLIVDDCEDDRLIMRERLESHPLFEFAIAESATLNNAGRQFGDQVPDVIICDYMMGSQSAVPNLISWLHKHKDLSAVLVTDKPGVAEDRLAMKFIGHEKTVFITKKHIDDVSLARAVIGSRFRMRSLR